MKAVNINRGWLMVIWIILLFILITPLMSLQASTPQLPVPQGLPPVAARGSVIILQENGAPLGSLTDKLVTDVEEFLGTYGGIVGAAVTFLVGVLKGIPALNGIGARWLNLIVSAILVGGLLLATNFGYGAAFNAGLNALPVIGKAVLALLAAFGFSTGFHEAARVYNVPVLGKKRTA